MDLNQPYARGTDGVATYRDVAKQILLTAPAAGVQSLEVLRRVHLHNKLDGVADLVGQDLATFRGVLSAHMWGKVSQEAARFIAHTFEDPAPAPVESAQPDQPKEAEVASD